MSKKIASAIFLSSLFALSSCGGPKGDPVTLELVDKYQGEYQVGMPIDTENFFYCSRHGQEKIEVSFYEGATYVTESVYGHTYYPKYSGDYDFVCTYESQRLEKTITVVDEKPLLSIPSTPYFDEAGPGKKVFYSDIYGIVSPTYSPYTASLEVNEVEYAPFDVSIDPAEHEYTKVTTTAKYFLAEKAGNYKVHVSVVNGSKSVDGVINVMMYDSLRDGNSRVYSIDGRYSSNRVIVNPDNPNIFTLPISNFGANTPYVALDEYVTCDDFLGIKFKGKNLPLVGLMAPGSEGDFSPSKMGGYFLTFETWETDIYHCIKYANGHVQNLKNGVRERGETFGLSSLDDDKYYYLNVSNSLANPQTSGSNAGKTLYCINFSFHEILDYGTPNEHLSDALIQIDSAGGFFDEMSTKGGHFVLYSSQYRDVTFEIASSKKVDDNIEIHGARKVDDELTYDFIGGYYTKNAIGGNVVAANGYIGFKGNYGAGDSICFEFKGKNIPGVALFCDDISGMTGGGQGILLSPGTYDANLKNRMTLYAPYRMDSSNPNDPYWTQTRGQSYINDGLGWNYRYDGVYENNSPFGYNNLDDDTDYLYRVNIISATTSVIIIGQELFKKVGDSYTSLHRYLFTLNARNCPYPGELRGNIIAYAGLDYNSSTAYSAHFKFKSYRVNESPLADENGRYVSGGTLTGNQVSLKGSIKDPTSSTPDYDSMENLSFLGVKGNGSLIGKNVKVNFTGKNIPNVCIMTDDICGQAMKGGRGVYLASSYIFETNGLTTNLFNSMKQMVFGPYRWVPSRNVFDSNGNTMAVEAFRYADLQISNSGLGFLEAQDGVNYEYIVSPLSLNNGILKMKITLNNLTSNVNVVTKTYDYDLASHLLPGDELILGDNVIFYGQGVDINFSYTIE